MTDVPSIANYVKEPFSIQGYDVSIQNSTSQGFIRLSKGGILKAVLGIRPSLNVEIRRTKNSISAEAKVDIFGQQAIPAMLSLFVCWPVLFTQISGLVKQSRLDDEVLEVIWQASYRIQAARPVVQPASDSEHSFCITCRSFIAKDAAFCPYCGIKQSS